MLWRIGQPLSPFVERLIRAAKLDVHLYEEVEADKGALGQAMGVVVLSSVASGVGLGEAGGVTGIVAGTIAALAGWFIWAFLTYFIGTKLLPEPQLIIADEPTTALDVTIQAQILKLLRRLATERGVSVLFTTHDLGTAYEICDRITVMYAGQEVEAAPSDEFFAAPRHPYTKRLLESLPSREHGIRGIPGSIPGVVDPPRGCRFHPRCDFATAECREARPGVTEAGERHMVRCYHPVSREREAAE